MRDRSPVGDVAEADLRAAPANINIISRRRRSGRPSRGSASNGHPVVATMIDGGLEGLSSGFGVWESRAPFAGILSSVFCLPNSVSCLPSALVAPGFDRDRSMKSVRLISRESNFQCFITILPRHLRRPILTNARNELFDHRLVRIASKSNPTRCFRKQVKPDLLANSTPSSRFSWEKPTSSTSGIFVHQIFR